MNSFEIPISIEEAGVLLTVITAENAIVKEMMEGQESTPLISYVEHAGPELSAIIFADEADEIVSLLNNLPANSANRQMAVIGFTVVKKIQKAVGG